MVRPISILSSIDQRLTYQMRKRQGGDVVLDQPWSLASSKLIDNVKFFEQTGKNYLVSNFSYSKGLGNLMFQYASLRSIAEIRGSILIVPVTTTLRRAFKLDAIFATDDVIKELLKSAENSTIEIPSCCSFVSIPNATDKPISAIIGYLQNPRYFYPVNEVLVRREFTFLPSIKNQALLFLSTIVRRRALKRARPLYDNNNAKTGDEAFEMEPSALTDDLYYIGVHVRRGMDIVMNERNLRHGHKAANADYYRRAMQLAKGERENVCISLLIQKFYVVT
ncbi:hypothetical protein DICVIV_12681 [Dictyocaulus viviparus]|uniref:L-Fucosyltransferase n=1 Tax=Dictyocaulus viviparus TaxID=29172 RepID=A0A0D8X9S3_DICVI|nr:hypothetical protein DICVIV_12681 [Dictyocaulus viviparus]